MVNRLLRLLPFLLVTAGCLRDAVLGDDSTSEPLADTSTGLASSTTDDSDTSSGAGSSSGEPGSDSDTTAAPVVCGDGHQDPGELCDDGPNNSDQAHCKLDCTLQVCGDGQLGPGELCDDGNLDDSDACTASCVLAACGDGFVQADEDCDDGNLDNSDACTTICMPSVCGDGLVHVGVEVCDERFATATCDSDCTKPLCGDGLANAVAGEACDDGNAVNTDGCTALCEQAACGDGFVQFGETCDDGGVVPGDGCDPLCKKETVTCQNQATLVSAAPDNRAVLCQRPEICEQDFAILCPKDWHLCSADEFNARNSGWNYAPTKLTLGAIRCREGGGAGQYGFKTIMSIDHLDNCLYSSSRPQCLGNFGCDEKNNHALCCAPLASCGNGLVNHPEEQCDDGNVSDNDACLNNCITTYAPAAQGC